MEFIGEELQDYVQKHTTEESELLKRIDRETHANVLMPRMLSGHLQGRVLSMISKIASPKTILEIGTYTGYSAICLAEGIKKGGTLITLDINEELEERVRGYFSEANLDEVIDYRIGNALDIIPTLSTRFDLVFIDADKVNYCNYYDLVIDKMKEGGMILADNVLWSGKVLSAQPDKDTRAIIEFNRKVTDDSRVENVLFPVRDGLMVIRKL
ncbi:MAG: O-methyltransferase [Cyclobacteriaceae bacterium]